MKVKRFISTMLLSSFLFHTVSYAQSIPDPDAKEIKAPPKVDVISGGDIGKVLSPLKKGQRAPFEGVLFSPEAAAEIIVGIETIEERIQIEVNNAIEKEKNECKKSLSDQETKLTSEKKELKAESDEKTRTINSLNLDLDKAKKEKTNPGLWLGIGVAGGVAMTLLTVFAVSQATK